MSDNISRQAVLNYPIRLDRYDAEHGNRDFVLGIESVMDYVESLPSAESNADQRAQRVGNVDIISRTDAEKALDSHRYAYENKHLNDYEQGWNDAIDYAVDEWLDDLPPAEPKTDDESELKFYYVESVDDYWVGRRLDNFYYANWHEGLGFVWSHSRYLPWGEHIVDENTLWKEHTYPSEPIEIPFTEWIVGFHKKYLSEPKTGKWKDITKTGGYFVFKCSECGERSLKNFDFCPFCGAKMRGE